MCGNLLQTNLSCCIYVVSLKEAASRRAQLKQQFPIYFPKMIICDAIDGKYLLAEQYFNLIKNSYAKYLRIMTPREVGCALSHKKVWEHFLATKARYALIFEDDVIGNDSGISKVLYLLELIDKKIGPYVVWLCGGMDGLPKDKVLCRKTIVDEIFEIPAISWKYVYRAVAYVISREAAYILHAKQTTDLSLADDWRRLLNKSGLKLLYSEIFHHPIEQKSSTIEEERAAVQRARWNRVVKTLLSKVYHCGVACGGRLLGYRKLSTLGGAHT